MRGDDLQTKRSTAMNEMSERLNALALESTILTSTSTIYVSIEDDVAGTCLLQAKIMPGARVPKLIILALSVGGVLFVFHQFMLLGMYRI